MKKRSIYLELLITFLVFFLAAYFIEGQGINEFIKLILTVSTFIFAILLAFSTANRHSRLNAIRQLLRSDDAALLSIYYSSKNFGRATTNKCRKILDEYLQTQIDYELVDYEKSTPKFLELYQFILGLKAKTVIQKEAKGQMLNDIRDSMKNQKEVIYWVNDQMQKFEWISLTSLCAIIMWCLFYINNGSIIAQVIIPVLGVSLVLLLLVLRDLNKLYWQEKHWDWLPLADLLQELDLTPYFPEDLFILKRLKLKDLKHIKKYRVGFVPNYPDLKGKTVRMVVNK